MAVAIATSRKIRRKAWFVLWSRNATILRCLTSFLFLFVRINLSKISCDSFSPSQMATFILPQQQRFRGTSRPTFRTTPLFSFSESNMDHDDSSEINYMNDLKNRAETIHVEQLRDQLEQANTRSFLKHAPWKLPYIDARLWIQANLGPSTKEEFNDLVENGNLRTPYIPKRPEEYYTRTREWISWDHFLTGLLDQENPSAIQPSTGFFD
jgi:hypothetical protein